MCRQQVLLPLAAASIAVLMLAGCGRKAPVRAPAPPPITAEPQHAGSGTGEPAAVQPRAPGVASAATIPPARLSGPPIRIGLTTAARQVRISAPGSFYVAERAPEAARRTARGELELRIERGETMKDLFRIQLASLSRREAAEAMSRHIAESLRITTVVRENPSAGTYQVRVGDFPSREAAAAFARDTLFPAGYRDTLVVRESPASAAGEMRLAVRGEGLYLLSRTGFLMAPTSTSDYLRLDGRPYRGILEVFAGGNGLLTVVNQVGMEDYLLGVVPAEISPTRYPELAALAAQSIAARTYALKNLGRFRADGFDLTADTRTQVYGGVALEQELTTLAVGSTAGLAVFHRDALIDAMYASTCGGHTEDFSLVFDAPDVPYLRGVACTTEFETSGPNLRTIMGRHALHSAVFTSDGQLANRNLELAAVLGIAEKEALRTDYAAGTPAAPEVRGWISRACAVAGRGEQPPGPEAQELLTRAGFIHYAAHRFFGSSEIERRIARSDAAYYLGTLSDQEQIPAHARSAFAFLMQAGLWNPMPDHSARPEALISRAEALSTLVRWVENRRPGVLRAGTFAGAGINSAGNSDASVLAIGWGTNTRQFTLVSDLRLFRLSGGRSEPVATLPLIGSERLRFHVDGDGRIDFMEAELNPAGASSDRYSPVSSWETTISRAELAEKLKPFSGGIGELLDLQPARRGTSGRAVRMQLEGSSGITIMNGYRFRNALGLRDTLFTITREVTPDGRVAEFTFRGRGWGHGVGLCQTGAYGMARAGRSYEEILKTYYQGTELRKAY